MSISAPSLVFSPSLYVSFPAGRPGVNPALLHLAQTTHTPSAAAAAHQQRASVHVCITQRHADKKPKWHLSFGGNNKKVFQIHLLLFSDGSLSMIIKYFKLMITFFYPLRHKCNAHEQPKLSFNDTCCGYSKAI